MAKAGSDPHGRSPGGPQATGEGVTEGTTTAGTPDAYSRQTRARSGALVLFAVVSIVVLLQVALVDSRSEWVPVGVARTSCRVGALLLTGLVAGWTHKVVKKMVLGRLRPAPSRTRPHHTKESDLVGDALPPVQVVETRTSIIYQRYYNEVISLFTSMLVEPRFPHRLEQQFLISHGRTSISSRAQFVLSGADRDAVTRPRRGAPTTGSPDQGQENAVVVVPLMRLHKDALLDDLHITDAEGTRLVALNRNETLGIITEGLIGLFQLAFFDSDNPASARLQADFQAELGRERKAFHRARQKKEDPEYDPAKEQRSPYVRDFRKLQQLISVTEIVSADAARAFFNRIASGMPDKNDEHIQRLRDFCVFFAENYILAVECPLPKGFYLSVSSANSSIPIPVTGSRNDRVRTFFGLSPFRYWVPIEAAQIFPSYHAELDGRARRQYILSQSVLTRKSETDRYVEITSSDLGSDTLRVRHDAGPAFPHVHYVSSRPQVEPKRLIWEVRLAEIPPGSLGPVFAMSLAVMGVLVAFTFTAPLFTSTDLDAPALTIALPIFALSLFGYTFDRLIRSSLLAAVAFLVNGLLAVGGALILLTVPDNRFVPRTSRLLGLQYHSLLLVGAILSAILVVFLFSAWRILLADYTQRTRNGHDIILGGSPERRTG